MDGLQIIDAAILVQRARIATDESRRLVANQHRHLASVDFAFGRVYRQIRASSQSLRRLHCLLDDNSAVFGLVRYERANAPGDATYRRFIEALRIEYAPTSQDPTA
jgi:hypothetical protein